MVRIMIFLIVAESSTIISDLTMGILHFLSEKVGNNVFLIHLRVTFAEVGVS